MEMTRWPEVSRFPITPFGTVARAAGPAGLPCHRPGLRISRPADEARLPGQAGRMRLSGRLADVCAELERLTQLEAH